MLLVPFLFLRVGTPSNSRLGPPSNSSYDPDVRGVLTYDHDPSEPIPVPQSETWNVTNPTCHDIDYSLLKPHPSTFLQPHPPSLEQPSLSMFLNYTFPFFSGPDVHTLVNGQIYQVNDTAYPTLYSIQEDPTWTPPAPEQRNFMVIPDAYRNKTVRIVLQSMGGPGSHPFHMHGHGFQVVASGVGSFDDAAVTLVNSVDLRSVVSRDTIIVPGLGWVAIQYVFSAVPYNMQQMLICRSLFGRLTADNPGVWALHCHVGELSKSLPALSHPPVTPFTATPHSCVCVYAPGRNTPLSINVLPFLIAYFLFSILQPFFSRSTCVFMSRFGDG